MSADKKLVCKNLLETLIKVRNFINTQKQLCLLFSFFFLVYLNVLRFRCFVDVSNSLVCVTLTYNVILADRATRYVLLLFGSRQNSGWGL